MKLAKVTITIELDVDHSRKVWPVSDRQVERIAKRAMSQASRDLGWQGAPVKKSTWKVDIVDIHPGMLKG